MPNQAKWYFDFVSPFSYLQFRRLDRVPLTLEYEMVPVFVCRPFKALGA